MKSKSKSKSKGSSSGKKSLLQIKVKHKKGKAPIIIDVCDGGTQTTDSDVVELPMKTDKHKKKIAVKAGKHRKKFEGKTKVRSSKKRDYSSKNKVDASKMKGKKKQADTDEEREDDYLESSEDMEDLKESDCENDDDYVAIKEKEKMLYSDEDLDDDYIPLSEDDDVDNEESHSDTNDTEEVSEGIENLDEHEQGHESDENNEEGVQLIDEILNEDDLWTNETEEVSEEVENLDVPEQGQECDENDEEEVQLIDNISKRKLNRKKSVPEIGIKKKTGNRSKVSLKKKTSDGVFKRLPLRSSHKNFHCFMNNLNAIQKNNIRDLGFGSLIDFPILNIPPRLAYYVLERFDEKQSVLEVNGKLVNISKETVHEVFGIPIGGKKIKYFEEAKMSDKVIKKWRTQFGKGRISIRQLLDVMMDQKNGGLNFKLNFLVLFMTIMAESIKCNSVHQKFLPSITKSKEIKNLDWCQYVFKCLKKTKSEWNRNSHFNGPIMFLMVVFAHQTCKDEECSLPLIKNWTSIKFKAIEAEKIKNGEIRKQMLEDQVKQLPAVKKRKIVNNLLTRKKRFMQQVMDEDTDDEDENDESNRQSNEPEKQSEDNEDENDENDQNDVKDDENEKDQEEEIANEELLSQIQNDEEIILEEHQKEQAEEEVPEFEFVSDHVFGEIQTPEDFNNFTVESKLEALKRKIRERLQLKEKLTKEIDDFISEGLHLDNADDDINEFYEIQNSHISFEEFYSKDVDISEKPRVKKLRKKYQEDEEAVECSKKREVVVNELEDSLEDEVVAEEINEIQVEEVVIVERVDQHTIGDQVDKKVHKASIDERVGEDHLKGKVEEANSSGAKKEKEPSAVKFHKFADFDPPSFNLFTDSEESIPNEDVGGKENLPDTPKVKELSSLPDTPKVNEVISEMPFLMAAPQTENIDKTVPFNEKEETEHGKEVVVFNPIIDKIQREERDEIKSKHLLSPYVMREVVLNAKLKIEEERLSAAIFSARRQPSETIFKSKDFKCSRVVFETMKPGHMIVTGVIDVWSMVLNYEENKRDRKGPYRLFCHTNIMTPEMTQSKIASYDDVDLVIQTFCNRICQVVENSEVKSFKDVDLVFFPMVSDEAYYIIVFNLRSIEIIILDNMCHENDDVDIEQIYGNSPRKLREFFDSFLALEGLMLNFQKVKEKVIKLNWRGHRNFTDSGIFAMRHMEMYKGYATFDFNCGFVNEDVVNVVNNQQKQLCDLRKKYITKMLTSKVNDFSLHISSEVEEYFKLPCFKRELYEKSSSDKIDHRINETMKVYIP